MLFDLSFDTVDYLVPNTLVSLGFQATILFWFSSHFTYMLLLRLHCLVLLLSQNVNVEVSQDSVFGPLFFFFDTLTLSWLLNFIYLPTAPELLSPTHSFLMNEILVFPLVY